MNQIAPTEWAALPADERSAVQRWGRELAMVKPPVGAALVRVARVFGASYATARRKYDAWRRQGEAGLVNQVRAPRQALAPELVEHFKSMCERSQRKCRPAYRRLVTAFLAGEELPGVPMEALRDRLPEGWSYRNFMRFKPTAYELAATRVGRSAAANFRPLVFTTRRNLWVGSHYLFDDIWHDHFCNCLDSRKTGRPLEFHALDLFSACKFAWGMRLRLEQADGRMGGLTEENMRFLLAYVLGAYGYNPERGTVLVVEHGTAAIREDLEELLGRISGGKITVSRSGIEGDPAIVGQYAGRGKGNFRFKAALESLGNLIHNELDHLPAQTGMDTGRRPEGTHGLLKYNDALLAAVAALPAERAAMLRWPVLEFRQFQGIAGQIYERINRRTEHRLEGWEGMAVPAEGSRFNEQGASGLVMRRLSPREVFDCGRRGLVPLPEESLALILRHDLGIERRVGQNHMIEVHAKEFGTDPARFLALGLAPGEKFLTVLNPFRPDRLFLFDAQGCFKGCASRWNMPCKSDIEAVNRQCGQAAKAEAMLLEPVRRRGLALTRERAELHAHNAQVLAGAPLNETERVEMAEARQIGRAAAEDILAADEVGQGGDLPGTADEQFLEELV
jgi:hypothetical protein